MVKKAEEILDNIEESLKFFSQIGMEFISSSIPSNISFSDTLKERILFCQKCPLAQTRNKAVPGEGSLEAELMFVGEAPGRDEDIQGKPFVGKAGQLLTKIINAMNYSRDEVYITNVIKCRPPDNRTPHRDEIEKCQSFLLEQIKWIKPRVIVALGKVAAVFFIKSNVGMTKLRGNFHEFQSIQVMPTFHPSYLVRNEGNRIIRKMVWEDMQKVMAFLDRK